MTTERWADGRPELPKYTDTERIQYLLDTRAGSLQSRGQIDRAMARDGYQSGSRLTDPDPYADTRTGPIARSYGRPIETKRPWEGTQ